MGTMKNLLCNFAARQNCSGRETVYAGYVSFSPSAVLWNPSLSLNFNFFDNLRAIFIKNRKLDIQPTNINALGIRKGRADCFNNRCAVHFCTVISVQKYRNESVACSSPAVRAECPYCNAQMNIKNTELKSAFI